MHLRKFILLLVVLIPACSFLGGEEGEGQPLARVHDLLLYESDIQDIFINAETAQDSMVMRQNFVKNWVREQLIFQKALENLPDEQKNKEKQLQEYYRSLIRYEYENELLRQKLNEEVTSEEVEDYYEANLENFKLIRPIVRLIYLKVPLDAPRVHKIRDWYTSDEIEAFDSLYVYGTQYAAKFTLDDKQWHFVDEVENYLPVREYTTDSWLRGNPSIELSDSNYYYFINFKDHREKNEISPLEFVMDDIKTIIINKRKLVLIKEMEEKNFKEALLKNEIEFYEEEE